MTNTLNLEGLVLTHTKLLESSFTINTYSEMMVNEDLIGDIENKLNVLISKTYTEILNEIKFLYELTDEELNKLDVHDMLMQVFHNHTYNMEDFINNLTTQAEELYRIFNIKNAFKIGNFISVWETDLENSQKGLGNAIVNEVSDQYVVLKYGDDVLQLNFSDMEIGDITLSGNSYKVVFDEKYIAYRFIPVENTKDNSNLIELLTNRGKFKELILLNS